jgi:hypothetical protein
MRPKSTAGKTTPTLATFEPLVRALGGKVAVDLPLQQHEFLWARMDWMDRPAAFVAWGKHKDWQSQPPLPRRKAPKPTGKPDNS